MSKKSKSDKRVEDGVKFIKGEFEEGLRGMAELLQEFIKTVIECGDRGVGSGETVLPSGRTLYTFLTLDYELAQMMAIDENHKAKIRGEKPVIQ